MKGLFMTRRIFCLTALFGIMVLLFPAMTAASAGKAHSYDLAELITQYVREHSSWEADDIRIEFSAKISRVNLKGENISYDISRSGKEAMIGNCHFMVRFFDDGIQVAKYPVRADIEIRENYLASARVIKRNAILEPNDIQVMKRWVRNPSLKSIADAGEIVGKRLVADVGPDREIKRSMIKEPVLVKKGEMVRIVLDDGQMSVMAVGVAEEEGVERQRIRVKNLSSQKVIFAKVEGEAFVRVESF